MDANQLRTEIESRDEKIHAIDSIFPSTVETLIDTYKSVKIESGYLNKVDFVEGSDDSSWEYEERFGELVVKYTPMRGASGEEFFFMIGVKFDSWDSLNWYVSGEITRVRHVPVQRMVWEEVV